VNSEVLGVFSAVRISYPRFLVAGIRLTGERGDLPTRGCDEDGKAGGQERRTKLRLHSLGAVECKLPAESHSAILILIQCFQKVVQPYEK
jgi:hypothetical protein